VAAALAVVLALNVDLGGDDEETVVPIGDGTITVAADAGDEPADQMRASIVALIAELGFEQSVVDCYEREVEEVPDAEFAELFALQAQGSDSELFDAMKPLKQELSATCIPRGEAAAIDIAGFEDNQVEVLKEALIRNLEGRFLADAPPAFTACLTAEVRAMPASEFKVFVESGREDARQIFLELRRQCL
jgi:hypothetical protein